MNEVLEVRALTHRYGSITALDNVDLTVEAGECVALLGPNGAGKTTLVGSTIGLIRPQSGNISTSAGDPREPETRRHLGIVQQEVGFPKTLTVRDIMIGSAARAGSDSGAAQLALAEMGLDGLEERRAATLSGGQQQRLQLAMGLIADPPLLILDEPTVGLDVAARQNFWKSIRSRRDRGTGVLLTTHIVDEAGAVADRIVVIANGRTVATGSPPELARVLPDRRIRARTTIDERRMRAWPGVASAVREDDEVFVTAIDGENTVRRMLELDPELSQLTLSTATLDEVLIALTQDQEVAA